MEQLQNTGSGIVRVRVWLFPGESPTVKFKRSKSSFKQMMGSCGLCPTPGEKEGQRRAVCTSAAACMPEVFETKQQHPEPMASRVPSPPQSLWTTRKKLAFSLTHIPVLPGCRLLSFIPYVSSSEAVAEGEAVQRALKMFESSG